LNTRERFIRTLGFEKPDRLPFCEWLGWWPETINRWYGEGLPIGVEVKDYFGFDPVGGDKRAETELFWRFTQLRGEVGFPEPIDFGPIPRFIAKTVEENERYEVGFDEWGIKKKTLKTSRSMPSFIDFPVKTRGDFEKMKKRYDPKDPKRYPKTWSPELVEFYETADYPIGIGFPGFFGLPRQFMGLENLLLSFYRDPKFIHEILDFWADFVIETAERAVQEARIDYANIWEDMGYNKGPHISPRLFEEFLLPRYREVTGFLKKSGVEIIMVDSDGDMNVLIPLFLEGGVNCMYPFEARANMNVANLRKLYGKKLALIGGIDKLALIEGKEAIRKEVESKVPSLAEEGGYIPSIDHLVPPDVPFENYRYYIELLKSHLGRV